MTPTSHSLAKLREDGWTAQVVEKWIPQARRRVDLWGFGDILAMHADHGLLIVQATSTSNAPSRVTKAMEQTGLALWLSLGHRAEVWGWAKRGDRGKRKLWTLKVYPLTLQMPPADNSDDQDPGVLP